MTCSHMNIRCGNCRYYSDDYYCSIWGKTQSWSTKDEKTPEGNYLIFTSGKLCVIHLIKLASPTTEEGGAGLHLKMELITLRISRHMYWTYVNSTKCPKPAITYQQHWYITHVIGYSFIICLLFFMFFMMYKKMFGLTFCSHCGFVLLPYMKHTSFSTTWIFQACEREAKLAVKHS